jgi:uncharacterized protein (UPF0303 family)
MSADPAPVTLDEITAQVVALDFERFGHADAWAVGQTIASIASDRSVAITAAIWLGEQRVFHFAAAGTSADNDQWMERKAALVRRYDAPSWQTTLRWRGYGITEESPRFGLDPALHSLSGGGFPIRVRGTSVGVAVVSGLDDNADHALVVEALRAHLPVQP